MTELKPCPWCNSQNLQFSYLDFRTPLNKESPVWMECQTCGARGKVTWVTADPRECEVVAIKGWNSYIESDDLPEWMKEKIRVLQDNVMQKSAHYFNGYIHATLDILSLHRGDDEHSTSVGRASLERSTTEDLVSELICRGSSIHRIHPDEMATIVHIGIGQEYYGPCKILVVRK